MVFSNALGRRLEDCNIDDGIYDLIILSYHIIKVSLTVDNVLKKELLEWDYR